MKARIETEIKVKSKPLTNKEYNKLYNFHPLTDLILQTGVRRREVKRLIDNYQDQKDYVNIKTKKSGKYKNRIYLTNEAISNIKKLSYLKNKSVRTYGRLFTKISQKSNIKFTPHILRSTFATRALEVGVDLVTLQYLMNHKSIVMTAAYVRHTENTLRAALESIADHKTISGYTHQESIQEVVKLRSKIKRLESKIEFLKQRK